jgi:signal transduction histidine kinase
VDKAFRDRLAAGSAILALTLGAGALVNHRVDLGLQFQYDGTLVRIVGVTERSPAAAEGFEAGMIVLSLNDSQLVRMPQYVYPECTTDACFANPPEPTIEPPVPTPVKLDVGTLSALLAAPTRQLMAIRQADYALASPESNNWIYVGRDYLNDLSRTAFALLAGIVLFGLGVWWLALGRAGESLRQIAIPLAAATALPLLLAPANATWAPLAVLAAGVLLPFGIAPLGLALASKIEDAEVRGVARGAAIACTAAAMLLAVGRSLVLPPSVSVDLVWTVTTGAIALVPGMAAALRMRAPEAAAGPGGRGLVQSAELGAAGATPFVALVTVPGAFPLLWPLSLWLAAILAAGRFTIRPLARLAARATLQRDLIVAATEAERARVAADIHDDALQELTLLVRRLDDAGDSEGADIARTVSDRLRAICGDLRLPILDDLGVGPALDWLVLRIERLAGGEVRLERSDGTRLPPDVELAIFRVAQEALGNAVKHGRPPIVVRYRATEVGASLSIDDSGEGIAPDAASIAEHAGRFGLLNMQQRAEQIGAILDIRQWPGGGTHVALEWRPR